MRKLKRIYGVLHFLECQGSKYFPTMTWYTIRTQEQETKAFLFCSVDAFSNPRLTQLCLSPRRTHSLEDLLIPRSHSDSSLVNSWLRNVSGILQSGEHKEICNERQFCQAWNGQCAILTLKEVHICCFLYSNMPLTCSLSRIFQLLYLTC
jgi:hypothetical protein